MAPIQLTPKMRAQQLALCSTRGVYYHPRHPGCVIRGNGALDELLATPPFRDWPRDGWILIMLVVCPHCQETRLIEQQVNHQGILLVVCQVCGRESPAPSGKGAPPAPAGSTPG